VRTFAALLTFFAIFIIAWLALVPVGVFVVDWMGATGEAALGLVLFVAPVTAYFAGIAFGMFVIARRSQPETNR
jgi:hypothetical protein